MLGTTSPTFSSVSASGAIASPPTRFCTPLPISTLPCGANRLNKIVPPTSAASPPTSSVVAVRLPPPASRRWTMIATPRMPRSRPATLRAVSGSPSSAAASTAVRMGLALATSAARPAEAPPAMATKFIPR